MDNRIKIPFYHIHMYGPAPPPAVYIIILRLQCVSVIRDIYTVIHRDHWFKSIHVNPIKVELFLSNLGGGRGWVFGNTEYNAQTML